MTGELEAVDVVQVGVEEQTSISQSPQKLTLSQNGYGDRIYVMPNLVKCAMPAGTRAVGAALSGNAPARQNRKRASEGAPH